MVGVERADVQRAQAEGWSRVWFNGARETEQDGENCVTEPE